MTYVTVRTWQTQRKEMRKQRGNQEWLLLKRGPRWKGETHEGRRGGTAGGQWLPFKCHSMKQSSWVFFLKKRKSCVSFKLAAHVMETCLEKSVGLVIQKGKKKKWEAAWWKALCFFPQFCVPESTLAYFFYPRRQHSLLRQGHQTCRLPKHPILDGVLDDFTPSAPLPHPFLLPPPPPPSCRLHKSPDVSLRLTCWWTTCFLKKSFK